MKIKIFPIYIYFSSLLSFLTSYFIAKNLSLDSYGIYKTCIFYSLTLHPITTFSFQRLLFNRKKISPLFSLLIFLNVVLSSFLFAIYHVLTKNNFSGLSNIIFLSCSFFSLTFLELFSLTLSHKLRLKNSLFRSYFFKVLLISLIRLTILVFCLYFNFLSSQELLSYLIYIPFLIYLFLYLYIFKSHLGLYNFNINNLQHFSLNKFIISISDLLSFLFSSLHIILWQFVFYPQYIPFYPVYQFETLSYLDLHGQGLTFILILVSAEKYKSENKILSNLPKNYSTKSDSVNIKSIIFLFKKVINSLFNKNFNSTLNSFFIFINQSISNTYSNLESIKVIYLYTSLPLALILSFLVSYFLDISFIYSIYYTLISWFSLFLIILSIDKIVYLLYYVNPTSSLFAFSFICIMDLLFSHFLSLLNIDILVYNPLLIFLGSIFLVFLSHMPAYRNLTH